MGLGDDMASSFGGWGANQINSSMGFGPGGVGTQGQDVLNNLYGQGGFGAQTDYYSGLGAAYGLQTGGFGADLGPMNPVYNPNLSRVLVGQTPSSVFDTGAAAYNPYYDTPAGKAFWSEMYGGGGIGSDAARAPNQPAITPQQTYVGGYNPYDPSIYAPAAQPNVGSSSRSPLAQQALLTGTTLGQQPPQQPAQDPRYWSGNFFGANNGAGIGQGAGMAPGFGGFNNPAVNSLNNNNQAFNSNWTSGS